MNISLGKKIKYLRLQSGMTQQELAHKLGKNYSTVGKWELDQRRPNLDTLFDLSNIFNCTIAYLAGYSNEPNEDFPDDDHPLYYDPEPYDDKYDEFINYIIKNEKYISESDMNIIKTIIEERIKDKK